LATIYGSQGLHIEAESLEKEVLSIRKEILGNDHPETLRALVALAITLSNQGQYWEAAKLL
ncbi:hypothetical protein CPB86DRAFT_663370, partial [Serendipita vermifera]